MRYQYVNKLLSSVIVLMVFALIAPVQGFGQRDDYQKSQGERKIQLKIPESLKAEHVELHEDLARAIKAGGNVPSEGFCAALAMSASTVTIRQSVFTQRMNENSDECGTQRTAPH